MSPQKKSDSIETKTEPVELKKQQKTKRKKLEFPQSPRLDTSTNKS